MRDMMLLMAMKLTNNKVDVEADYGRVTDAAPTTTSETALTYNLRNRRK
jgi:hypothetical protein